MVPGYIEKSTVRVLHHPSRPCNRISRYDERRAIVHLLFFVLFAILLAYSIYSSRRNAPKEVLPSWLVATSETVNWQDLFKGRCESPAETEFLNAIISSYQLIPERGILKGGGLELQLQIPIGHYRADFLVNKHLVVEIDGAAYHSSPEAIEKDRIRDEFLIKSGYVVVRIPAKLVFNSPSDAVQRVRSAISDLAHERGIRAQEAARGATVSKSDPPRTFFGSLGQAPADASDAMDRALVFQKAKEAFNQASSSEVHTIECAMKLAKQRMEIAAWRRKDPRSEELYLESLKQLRAGIGLTAPSHSLVTISPFRLPEIDSDPKYSASLKEMYSALMEERLQYFNDIRRTLEKDSELAKHVEEALKCFVHNSDDLWHLIHATDTCNTVNIVDKKAVYGSEWMGSVITKEAITLKIDDEMFKEHYVERKAEELARQHISDPNT
jgi:very-short-patch-repair endonuclease